MDALERLIRRREHIKRFLVNDSSLKVSLSEKDYREYSSANYIPNLYRELKEVENAICELEQRGRTHGLEIRGGCGNQIVYSSLTPELQESMKRDSLLSLDNSLASKRALSANQGRILTNLVEDRLEVSIGYQRELARVQERSLERVSKEVEQKHETVETSTEDLTPVEYRELFKVNIKEKIIQKAILFIMSFTNGERHDMLAERLVKNIKWEYEDQ